MSSTGLIRTLSCILLSCIVTTAIAGDNAKERPFKAVFAGYASWAPDGECPEPFLRTYSDLEGNATHLGLSLYEADHCTALVPEGEGRLVAANGDEIAFTYVAPMIQPPGPVIVMQGPHTVTGGTGRFEGASGMLLGTVYLTVMDESEPVWPLEIVLVGTIVY